MSLMNQPTVPFDPSCMDEYDPASLPVEEALRRIDLEVQCISGVERVALRSGLGRILAQPVSTLFDVPLENNSAMDGYAIHGDSLLGNSTVRLAIIGTRILTTMGLHH